MVAKATYRIVHLIQYICLSWCIYLLRSRGNLNIPCTVGGYGLCAQQWRYWSSCRSCLSAFQCQCVVSRSALSADWSFSSSEVFLQVGCTQDSCRRKCSTFLIICLWINEVVFTSNMTEHLLIFSLQSQIYLSILPLGDGLGVGFPTNGQSDIQTSANCFIVLRHESKATYIFNVGRRAALLVRTFAVPDRIRKSQRNLQQATRAVHNRAAKWSVAECGFHENSFKHKSV